MWLRQPNIISQALLPPPVRVVVGLGKRQLAHWMLGHADGATTVARSPLPLRGHWRHMCELVLAQANANSHKQGKQTLCDGVWLGWPQWRSHTTAKGIIHIRPPANHQLHVEFKMLSWWFPRKPPARFNPPNRRLGSDIETTGSPLSRKSPAHPRLENRRLSSTPQTAGSVQTSKPPAHLYQGNRRLTQDLKTAGSAQPSKHPARFRRRNHQLTSINEIAGSARFSHGKPCALQPQSCVTKFVPVLMPSGATAD